ncbi:MAG: hypothetical protein V3U75_10070 [Methylococcaceae bacterium]
MAVASGDEITDLYPGCIVEGTNLHDLNQEGEILFSASFAFNSDLTCPKIGLFTWKNGVIKKIVALKDPVPGFPSGTFFLIYHEILNWVVVLMIMGMFLSQQQPQRF